MEKVNSVAKQRMHPHVLAVVLCAAAMIVAGLVLGLTQHGITAKALTEDSWIAYTTEEQEVNSGNSLYVFVDNNINDRYYSFTDKTSGTKKGTFADVGKTYMQTPTTGTIKLPMYTYCVPNIDMKLRFDLNSEYIFSHVELVGPTGKVTQFEKEHDGKVFVRIAMPGAMAPDLAITFRYVFEHREPIPMPEEPTKEGHHFVGWYYDAAFTRPYNGENIYEPTNFYAKFEINTYTVQYLSAGGIFVEPATVDWNTAAPTTTPERTGYNFMGWALPDGTPYTGQGITQDTMLTAKWEIKRFDVTFYIGEEVYKTITVDYGTTLQKAMDTAKISSYAATTVQGRRVAKQSVITENAQVLVHKTHGWEKYGDWVGRNHWYTWLMLALGLTAAAVATVTIIVLIKYEWYLYF